LGYRGVQDSFKKGQEYQKRSMEEVFDGRKVRP